MLNVFIKIKKLFRRLYRSGNTILELLQKFRLKSNKLSVRNFCIKINYIS